MHETLYSVFFEGQCKDELGFSKWEVFWCCELVGEKSNLLVLHLVFKVRIQEILMCNNRNGIYIVFGLGRLLSNRSMLKENAWNVQWDWDF